ncbi:putative TRNA--methyltransferase non-catalytic subunit trm6MTase subunit trm6 [Senna tora]|uniref:Putative TRNA--methyltransferase non-catalytic subunit trm6MTase subunit trm6 n=1 Tax=Senna tora TaxID=362788 RepID=A0A834SSM2_9FABA|nr:putative TRNA--methyltransferase non-catalytic subunit trm6MTase subunit trm6 [Senna tora]
MNSFYFANVQTEKVAAMRRYSLFTAIGKTLRILEFLLALLLLFWILARLPFVLRISGHYVRKLSVFIASPLFVFIVSNAIIATLLAKSGRLTAPNSDADSNARTAELYQEFLKNTADRTRSSSEVEAEAESDDLLRVAEEEVVYQDKEIISDLNSAERTIQDRQADEIQTRRDSDSDGEVDSGFPKVYRRSQSEKMKEEDSTKTMRQKFLRRSETEKMYVENPRENLYPQDKLSNEEFQRTIEAFIAKQMRFLREESLAIVIQNQT